MTACEECWHKAYVIARTTGRHQAEVYRDLIQDSYAHRETDGPGQ